MGTLERRHHDDDSHSGRHTRERAICEEIPALRSLTEISELSSTNCAALVQTADLRNLLNVVGEKLPNRIPEVHDEGLPRRPMS